MRSFIVFFPQLPWLYPSYLVVLTRLLFGAKLWEESADPFRINDCAHQPSSRSLPWQGKLSLYLYVPSSTAHQDSSVAVFLAVRYVRIALQLWTFIRYEYSPFIPGPFDDFQTVVFTVAWGGRVWVGLVSSNKLKLKAITWPPFFSRCMFHVPRSTCIYYKSLSGLFIFLSSCTPRHACQVTPYVHRPLSFKF